MYRFIIDYGFRGITAELPLAPEVMVTRYGKRNAVLQGVNFGEINVLKDIGLREINFKLLLPRQGSFSENSEYNEPIFYLNLFRSIMADKKPFKLIILRELSNGSSIFGGDIMLSIESYGVTEKGGEDGDFYVDLKLKEYKTAEMSVTNEGGSDETGTVKEAREVKETASQHRVVSGECLWTIAKRELGDGEKYLEIAELNGIKYPYTINAGQVLRLK